MPTPPHRTAIGLANRERLSMLLEVLSKHTPLRLVRPGVSIFLNVVAGYKIAASEVRCGKREVQQQAACSICC